MMEFVDTKGVNSRLLGGTDLQEDAILIAPDKSVEQKTDAESFISKIEDNIRKEKLSPFINIYEVFEGGAIISNWKRYKRMIAKIVKIHPQQVELDCLTDEEKEIYQAKVISRDLLEDVRLVEGNYLLFNYYKKKNDLRLEILDDQRLFSKSQFPEVDFNKYENINFFKEE